MILPLRHQQKAPIRGPRKKNYLLCLPSLHQPTSQHHVPKKYCLLVLSLLHQPKSPNYVPRKVALQLQQLLIRQAAPNQAHPARKKASTKKSSRKSGAKKTKEKCSKLSIVIHIVMFASFVFKHYMACANQYPCSGLGRVLCITNCELKALLLHNLVQVSTEVITSLPTSVNCRTPHQAWIGAALFSCHSSHMATGCIFSITNVIQHVDDSLELRVVTNVEGNLTLPIFCSFLFLLHDSNIFGVHGGLFLFIIE
jgi:hypothetical protein